jgi:ketosteroid isomerase-like protein
VSTETLELARQAYDAWNRGDLDWVLDHMTEDFEFRPGLGFADLDDVYAGKEGWRRFSRTWSEAWDEITVTVNRIEDLGDRLVVLLTFDGRGRGSGVQVSLRVGQVATVRGNLLSKLESSMGWDEALRGVATARAAAR